LLWRLDVLLLTAICRWFGWPWSGGFSWVQYAFVLANLCSASGGKCQKQQPEWY